MSLAIRRRVLLAALVVLSFFVFFTGIHWGLPSRAADSFLFGDVPVWSGEKIMALAGERSDDARLGSDVTRYHVNGRDRIQVLNDNDRDRAEIIRRYRLYPAQPDENLPLLAIGRMRPAKFDFDPRLYQYGGLFLYPLAALYKLAGACGYLHVTTNAAYYVDHPEAIARFYVVTRAWAAIWGVVGVIAVFWIARRLVGAFAAASAAALAFMFMPAVINQAHEAKPHLQGAVLLLCAVIAAQRFVETGRRSAAWSTGAVCGAAFGTVLTSLAAFATLPVMVMLRSITWGERIRLLLGAALIGVAVYGITNPYVPINLVRNRAVLRSNLGNSTDMYHVGGWASGIPRGARLIAEGASPGLAIAGAFAALVAIARGIRGRRRDPNASSGGRFSLGCLLAAPAVLLLAQFFSLAAGKPGEYGRFAIYSDTVLALAALCATALWVQSKAVRAIIGAVLVVTTMIFGANYLEHFRRDASGDSTRFEAARAIQLLANGMPASIGLWAEPAPYSVPPVDLFRNRLVLLPRGYVPPTQPKDSPANIYVRAVDDPRVPAETWSSGYDRYLAANGFPAQISWADKPFVIYAAPHHARETGR